ncbi:MAG TPA: hemerythrin domain-containing protein [Bacteroidales bacterium]|jgi:Regulator of cell morphogenesis and NO signaling
MHQTVSLYLTPDVKMSDVILSNPYLMLLLEHFGIELPLQEKTMHEICCDNNINTELFLMFANLYNGNKYAPKSEFTYTDVLTIVNYLKNSHSYYSEEIYPNILGTIKKMYELNTHKEIALVEKFFGTYFNEVKEHLDYENKIVFPYIIELIRKIENPNYPIGHFKYSVDEYQDHHDDIEEKLDDLKNLLIKYLPQKDDQILRRKLLFSLFELDYDLNIHSQIEDLILVPLVAKMESHLTKMS